MTPTAEHVHRGNAPLTSHRWRALSEMSFEPMTDDAADLIARLDVNRTRHSAAGTGMNARATVSVFADGRGPHVDG
jgi:hypothetical protein